MKRVPLSKIKDDLSRFLREAEGEESLITRNGKPAGVLIGFGFGSEDDRLDYLRLLTYQIGGGLRRRCARRQTSNPTKPTASRPKVPGSGTPSASAAATAMIAWSAVVG